MHVITRLNVGGPAIYVDIVSSRLDPDRFETLLVAGREDAAEGSMVDLGRFRGPLEVVRVDTLSREVSGLHDVRALGDVTALARSFKPDVVHTHLTKGGFVGRLAARLAGTRAVVHTYHGLVFRGYFGKWESALYLNIERALARVTTRIIALSTGQRAELLRLGLGGPERIVTIPLGMDLAPFLTGAPQEEARRSLLLPSSAPIVGIVARLVAIKDVATFLRAIAIVRSSRPDLIALIVGDGPGRADLESLASDLGLSATCRFLGWRADVACLHAACDVIALSSLSEGSPTSLIEAMAAARAVVATAVGGVPDLIEGGREGLLVPPHDPAAMAAAILGLLGDPERRSRLGTAGRAAVYPKYDASNLLPRIERLYREVAGSPS